MHIVKNENEYKLRSMKSEFLFNLRTKTKTWFWFCRNSAQIRKF